MTAIAEPIELDADGAEKEDKGAKVIPLCDTIGFVFRSDRHYVTLVRRTHYKEETIGTRGRGAGKVYAAGTYSPWNFVSALYPSGPTPMEALKRALMIAAGWMIADGIEVSGIDKMQAVVDATIERLKNIKL